MDAEIQMSLAADLARLADAAERIAAALEDQHQDDEYEYLSVGLVAAHDAFQDGWRLWRVIGGELFMRRPRKQEAPAPAPDPGFKVHDRVIFLDNTTGIITAMQHTDFGWDFLIRRDDTGETLTYYAGEFKLDPIPF